jgi:hypothetical protein
MLLALGDGNWNSSEKDANFLRDKTGRGVSGNVVIQHYFGIINQYCVYIIYIDFFLIIFNLFSSKLFSRRFRKFV